MSTPAAVSELGRRAKVAATRLARASTSEKNAALLRGRRPARRSQRRDPRGECARSRRGRREPGWKPGPLDRLRLTEARIEAMAEGLRDVARLPDPVGEVLDGWKRPNGLQIERVRVPLGVIAIIYENRPNVTSDAAGICLKSGNAVAPARLGERPAVERRDRRSAARRGDQGRTSRATAWCSSRTSATMPRSS